MKELEMIPYIVVTSIEKVIMKLCIYVYKYTIACTYKWEAFLYLIL